MSFALKLCCLALFGCQLVSFAFCYEAVEYMIQDPVVAKKWIDASLEFDELLYPQVKPAINLINTVLSDKKGVKLNDSCRDALSVLSDGLKRRQRWAYECKLIMLVNHPCPLNSVSSINLLFILFYQSLTPRRRANRVSLSVMSVTWVTMTGVWISKSRVSDWEPEKWPLSAASTV